MAQTGVVEVAKKKASESRKHDRLVRMDDEIVDKAKKVAAMRGTSVAELFASILGPAIDREWAKEVKKITEQEGGK